ncbi:MAG: amino-acid N-acetyltransferase, partial [Gammaproteobacteria bacterium]|nr:amino-acid N-acetyltransferase [Gammaproteobacteria bacterium]
MDSAKFAQWFRSSSPYIRAHRNKVFLVYFTEEALAHELLTNIVHDLALLHVMGVRVVLVPELRCGSGIGSHPLDSDGLAEYLGQVGQLRNHLEAEFATGVPGSQFHSRHVPLVSGNFLQAKPRGIVQGVDMQFAGETRKVHEGEIRKLLEAGIVVLVPPLGHSSSGVMYALDSNEVAQKVAVSLGADKLILMGPIAKLGDHSDLTTQALDEVLAEIPLAPELQRQLQTLGDACKEGVARAHVISHEIDGSLLQELFTASGV